MRTITIACPLSTMSHLWLGLLQLEVWYGGRGERTRRERGLLLGESAGEGEHRGLREGGLAVSCDRSHVGRAMPNVSEDHTRATHTAGAGQLGKTQVLPTTIPCAT